MKREELENIIIGSGGGATTICELYLHDIDTSYLWDYDLLKECLENEIHIENWNTARNLIEALESAYDDTVFAWDSSMGSLEKPLLLNDPDDLIEWLIDMGRLESKENEED